MTLTCYGQLEDWLLARGAMEGPVGLVPTMGFLHAGHLSLVRRALAENPQVVVSIFVNPTQFVPGEDFASYPRDMERDLALLKEAGVKHVLAPTPEQMYPPGFQTTIQVGALAQPLEGAARPGHFDGVATVVAKLFGLTRPRRAYFGQKDGQQVQVVRRMALDLNLGVEVVVCPTLREADGLAMSSRNVYLKEAERRAAPVLFRALEAARRAWEQGERGGEPLRRAMARTVEAEPLARLEYVSLASLDTLQEAERAAGPVMASLVVKIGRARLIDNLILTP